MTSEEDTSGKIFNPKAFLESLFQSRDAEIKLIFHNATQLNVTNVEDGMEEEKYTYKPDIYFVIGAVSFIILITLCFAVYKAFVMLKISLDDGIDDTVPVDNPNAAVPNRSTNAQSAAGSGQFLNGTCVCTKMRTLAISI